MLSTSFLITFPEIFTILQNGNPFEKNAPAVEDFNSTWLNGSSEINQNRIRTHVLLFDEILKKKKKERRFKSGDTSRLQHGNIFNRMCFKYHEIRTHRHLTALTFKFCRWPI